MNRRDILKGTIGAAIAAGIGMTDTTRAAEALADGDAAVKKFLLEECGMTYYHLGIPTDQDMEWDAYLENLKLHIMEYENDPFGIEWMKFEEGSPMPEIIQKRPHVAFLVNDLEKAAQGFELLLPISSPRPGMSTMFIVHKGIGIEFVMLSDK